MYFPDQDIKHPGIESKKRQSPGKAVIPEDYSYKRLCNSNLVVQKVRRVILIFNAEIKEHFEL